MPEPGSVESNLVTDARVVRRLEIDRESGVSNLVASKYPASEGWIAQTFRIVNTPTGFLELRVGEARRDDAALASALLALGRGTLTFVFAYRAVSTDNGATASVISLASVNDGELTERSRSVVPQHARPTAVAIRDGWRDDSHDSQFYKCYVGSAQDEVISAVSWNGKHSLDVAEVMHPKYTGGYHIDSQMDNVVRDRTDWELPYWPEAVWFLRARFIPADVDAG